jgi:dihydroorotate dehydrogenase
LNAATEDAARLVRALLADIEARLSDLQGPAHDAAEATGVLEYGRRLIDQPDSADASHYADVLQRAARVCIKGQQPGLLDRYPELVERHGLGHPTYNIYASYADNAAGPWGRPPLRGVPVRPVTELFGQSLGIPFGVPASALTSNPNWVDFYASRGFNLLTFKTVREDEAAAHDAPNWLFTDGCEAPLPLDPPGVVPAVTAGLLAFPKDPRSFSTVNSFGVPSPPVEEWQAQVSDALALLRPGQMLMVSVMGATRRSLPETAAGFVRVAVAAEQTGAPVVELNLSCPNTLGPDGGVEQRLIFQSVDDTRHIVEAVRSALRPSTRLVAKLGYLPYDQLAAVLEPIAGLVDGVAGINTLQVEVTDAFNGGPAFGGGVHPPRPRAGLSGVAIRDYALDFVRSAARVRDDCGRPFAIVGIGGVMTAADVERLLDAGADAVQAATAAFANHELGREVADALAGRYGLAATPAAGPGPTPVDTADEVDAAVLRLVRRYGTVTMLDLRGLTDFTTVDLRASARRLERDGTVDLADGGGEWTLSAAGGRAWRRRLLSAS